MPHPYIFNGGLGLGTILFSLGANAMLRPHAHLASLGVPVQVTDPYAGKLNHALMRIWGIRNITCGLMISLIWTTGDERLMGWSLFLSTALPITDGFVCRLLIGGGAMQHWSLPPLLLSMSAGLLGWF